MSDTPTFRRCPLLPCGRSDASCCCMLSKACSGLGLGHAAVLLRKLRRLDDGLVLGELMAICGVQRYASCLCLHLVLPPAGRAVDAVLKHTSPGPAGKHVHPCSLSGDYTSLHHASTSPQPTRVPVKSTCMSCIMACNATPSSQHMLLVRQQCSPWQPITCRGCAHGCMWLLNSSALTSHAPRMVEASLGAPAVMTPKQLPLTMHCK